MDQLQPGFTVKIFEGPFAGFDGVVQAVDGTHITVMIMLFERETPVQLRFEELEWKGQDLRPTFQQELTNRLDSERTEKLNNWWREHLDQSEDDLTGEYRAFLQFRTRVDAEYARRSEQLHQDFSSLFTDRLLDEEGNAKLKARWSEWLERWGLERRGYDEPLTTFELRCLKRLDLIDDEVDLQASMRQRWQETLEYFKTQYTDATSEEWMAIEEGWWKDFERGALSAERKLLLAIWGIRDPSNLPSPHHYRSRLWLAADERHHRAEYASFRKAHMPLPEELAALRTGARQQAEAQREPVQAFFRQAYQLILPDHVFTFWAFWLGLTPLERAAMDWHRRLDENDEFIPDLGISPGGIFEYFEQAGRERVPLAGLDHRLNERSYLDPPEFFTALYGDTDGLRFGLWYDNPHKSSAFVASYYAGDPTGIAYEGQTLLEAVRAQIEWAEYHTDDYSDEEEERSKKRLSVWLLRDAVMEYETVNRPERGKEYVETYGKLEEKRIPTCNGLGVIVPPPYEQPLERDTEAVYQAILSDTSEVKAWINEALQACAQGQPALALALGHDLHWLWHNQPERKEAAHLLLTRAYKALGYQALAEIETLHHQYRDRPSVDIYHSRYDFSL
jgi:hypothetical protein